ncbi:MULTISPECIES: MFS transporter [Acidianus]|uniref:Multidrug transporter n=1 Tax=Candidatus Acidianus copahuensis TaxID=1160895 RepID=A0A031LS31_9CREN|nr:MULTISPECIES: MFS transporter [Acidianus]EZQ10550.1 multidrug transporter [Candidatus Acidianus copahuensis]NON63432.1 MFS transporter [Acidianus sp. RZ1]
MIKKEYFYFMLIIISLTFVIRGSNNIISTTVPLVAKQFFDFSNASIGILSALISFFMFIASGIVNPLLKNKIRRKLFIASATVYAIDLPLFSFSSSISVWLLSAVSGLSLGLIFPNIINATGKIQDEREKEKALALYTLSLSLSLIVGPLLESWFLKIVSLKNIFLLFSPFGIAAGILSFLIEFPPIRDEARGISILVLKNPSFITAIVNNTSYDTPFAAITAFGGIYGVQLIHLNYSTIALFFSIYFLSSFIARLYLSLRRVKNVGFHIYLSMIIAIFGLLILFLSTNVFTFGMAMFLLGIPHGLTYPLSLIALNRGFKPEMRNVANSTFFAIMSLVAIVTPLIVGELSSIIGLRLSFFSLIFLVLVSLFIIHKYVKQVDRLFH